jgi:hypothetical protein
MDVMVAGGLGERPVLLREGHQAHGALPARRLVVVRHPLLALLPRRHRPRELNAASQCLAPPALVECTVNQLALNKNNLSKKNESLKTPKTVQNDRAFAPV